MRYPEHVIEEVREQSDIVGIISDYTPLTKKGNSYFGLCPFHNEKTPSFSVSDEKQMYYCFGCGAGGNVITFMMEKENMSFPEAMTYLADRAHISLEQTESEGDHSQEAHKNAILEIYTKAAKFYYYTMMSKEYAFSLNYFTRRDMTLGTIKKFGLGYAPSQYNMLYNYLKKEGYDDALLLESGLCMQSEKSGRLYDRFSDRVMFPIFNTNKKVIAFGGRVLDDRQPKYMNSAESVLFDKSRTLYGLHLARTQKHPYYILVEGYMDVIAMHQAGFTQTVASLGTAFTSGHARLLKRYTNQVIILYDSDQAGKNATLRAIPILRNEGIHINVLQLEDGKDPDEFLKKFGQDKMQKLLENAKSDIWFRVTTLQQAYHLDIPDQKIKFLQEVSQIIAELPSTIEQSVYTKEIAQKFQIDQIALEVEIKKYYNDKLVHSNNKITYTKKVDYLGLMNSQLIFLSAVYHYNYVYPYIKEYINVNLFDEGLLQDLAARVFEAIETHQILDKSYFTTKYQSIDEQKMISAVFMHKEKLYEDKDALQKMLTETIKRLNKMMIERRLKQSTDIKEVQELLSKKKVLDKLYIALING